MTTAVDLGPLVTAAADYEHAVGRLDAAAGDAEAAWRLLPATLDSPGTQLAVGRYIGPAHQLSTALLQAADALHGLLATSAGPLRLLSAQAAASPDDPSLATRLAAAESDCAATIVAIRGGEAGSVDLPCPAPRFGGKAQIVPVSAIAPIAPIAPSSGLPSFGGALTGGASLGDAIAATGLLGVLGLVLSLGGSTDSATVAPAQSNRRPRPGIDEVRVTPYSPCSPWENGDGCEGRELGVPKPGDEPFTGDKVRGDEPPGEMPGTRSDWTVEPARNDEGLVYREPDSGKSERVTEPGHDARYPNGYVQFTNENGQVVDLSGRTVKPQSDAAHIVRNPDGSFPIPKGWNR